MSHDSDGTPNRPGSYRKSDRPSRPAGRGPKPRRSAPEGHGGRTSGGGRKPPGKKLSPLQVRQAKQLVEQSGVPFNAAVKIVLGKTTLNDVLQEMLREEKIRKLMESHGINRALATNIALGRTDLEIVLLRRRKNQTLQDHYMQSCLDDALNKHSKLALALHGNRKVFGKLIEVGKYTVQFLEDGQKDPIEIHKTEVKFAYDPDQFKLLKKFMGVDNKVRTLGLKPILRAKERHHFKNLTLQQSIDQRQEVDVVTLEGDTLRGQVEWFGRWEFGLKFKGGARVTLFRHAIHSLRLHQG